LSDPFTVDPISQAEIEPAVRIFLDAFAPNVRALYGDPPRPDAMVDVWTFARETEPGGFLGAHDGSSLLGYALFTSSVGRLERRALLSGRVVLWALRALGGRYGIRWSTIARQLWNKMLFIGTSGRFRSHGDAQLLNIAVASAARGRGVAKALVREGLRYLARRGVAEVRLEVQPDNTAAIAAYRSNGFIERGRMRNIHGEWMVMTATLSP
jgi:ribosomal protein S18 acetylase RimI-like enzyme